MEGGAKKRRKVNLTTQTQTQPIRRVNEHNTISSLWDENEKEGKKVRGRRERRRERGGKGEKKKRREKKRGERERKSKKGREER